MAIALPVVVDNRLVGTCFVGGVKNGKLLFITTLHHLGNGTAIQIAIPNNFGDISKVQTYPYDSIPTIEVSLVYSNPIYDIAVLQATTNEIAAPVPNYLKSDSDIVVGEDVLIVGYPYSPLGSALETAEKCSVSALGNRLFMDTLKISEFIVSHQTFPGSSGSPVVRASDGVVCGIIRGCLAPPEVISIGNLPLGTDSNITYVINSSVIPSIIDEVNGE